ncbi:hypothetical protein P3W45_001430 [Vairimorpha bombi]|jgi:hypothetical protein
MGNTFILKVVTDTNKRFILSLEPSSTTNTLIKHIKKYYMYYFKHKYYIEYIYTPDKFIIFDDMPLEIYFNSGDFCYIKGQEGSDCTSVDLPNKVKYDTFLRKKKTEHYEDTKRFKNNNPNILKDEILLADKISLTDNKNVPRDNRRKSKENIIHENGINLEGPNKLDKRKNNKNARNFNIKNGINPNLILKDLPSNPMIVKEDKIPTMNIVKEDKVPTMNIVKEDKIPTMNIVKEDKVPTMNIDTEKNNPKLENTNKPSLDKITEIPSSNNFSINTLLDSKNQNIKSQISNREPDNLFVLENINKSNKEKVVLNIDEIKQVKRKKKINYDEL